MPDEPRNDREAARKAADQIQENLRALYAETLDEALPEEFLRLLEELDRTDGKS